MYIQRILPKVLLLFVILGSVACEYDGPTAIWDPEKTAGANPVITEIIPDAMAPAGVNEIKIIGENFSENSTLYVGGIQVALKSASSTEISIYRPKFTGDSLTIKLVKPDAYEIAEYFPYAIETIGGEYGETENNDFLHDFDIDADENFVGYDRRKVFLGVPRDGLRTIFYECPKIRKVYDMKVGPGGAYYLALKKGNIVVSTPDDPNGSSFGRFSKSVTRLDFDQYGNIYTGGDETGLYVLKPDTLTLEYKHLNTYDLTCIRVFDDHVYVSGDAAKDDLDIKTGIWRLPILDNSGQLGDLELVMDWAEIGAKADTTALTDFTFAEDGTMYIATDGGDDNTSDPIFLRYPDGTLDTFYPGGLLLDAAGVSGPVVSLAWGNENYLYYWRGGYSGDSRRIIRLKMQQRGAPYYGRTL